MAVPKKKTSKSRRDKRRSHHALSVNLSVCAECGSAVFSHIICPTCGFYAGKEIKEVKKS